MSQEQIVFLPCSSVEHPSGPSPNAHSYFIDLESLGARRNKNVISAAIMEIVL